MVEFRKSSAFRGWVRVTVWGYGFGVRGRKVNGVRGRKVKSRDCALASDLVRAVLHTHLRAASKGPAGARCKCKQSSPNQVLTHAARAAAKQPPLVAARGAREGLWLEQQAEQSLTTVC